MGMLAKRPSRIAHGDRRRTPDAPDGSSTQRYVSTQLVEDDDDDVERAATSPRASAPGDDAVRSPASRRAAGRARRRSRPRGSRRPRAGPAAAGCAPVASGPRPRSAGAASGPAVAPRPTPTVRATRSDGSSVTRPTRTGPASTVSVGRRGSVSGVCAASSATRSTKRSSSSSRFQAPGPIRTRSCSSASASRIGEDAPRQLVGGLLRGPARDPEGDEGRVGRARSVTSSTPSIAARPSSSRSASMRVRARTQGSSAYISSHPTLRASATSVPRANGADAARSGRARPPRTPARARRSRSPPARAASDAHRSTTASTPSVGQLDRDRAARQARVEQDARASRRAPARRARRRRRREPSRVEVGDRDERGRRQLGRVGRRDRERSTGCSGHGPRSASTTDG